MENFLISLAVAKIDDQSYQKINLSQWNITIGKNCVIFTSGEQQSMYNYDDIIKIYVVFNDEMFCIDNLSDIFNNMSITLITQSTEIINYE